MTDKPPMQLGLGYDSIAFKNTADGSTLHAKVIAVVKENIIPTDIVAAHRKIPQRDGPDKLGAWVIPDGNLKVTNTSGNECTLTKADTKRLQAELRGIADQAVGTWTTLKMGAKCLADVSGCSIEKIITTKKGPLLNRKDGISYYALDVSPVSFNGLCPTTPKAPISSEHKGR